MPAEASSGPPDAVKTSWLATTGRGRHDARPMEATSRAVLGFVSGAIVGAAAVGLLPARTPMRPARSRPATDVRQGTIGLVNPLLECPEAGALRSALAPFRGEVESLLARRIRAGAATRVSVYFRDLNNGPWFTAGDPNEYRVASLLKVPLLIGYLKRAEREPDVLQRRLAYAGGTDAVEAQNVAPDHPLVPGESYTIEELLEHAIVYSDNEAAALLAREDGGQSIEAIRRLVEFPPFRDGNLYLTPRNFASMFRILYNASYLSEANSERALELLIRTAFRDGLVAGVPEGVRVANKFGERVDDGVTKLHDCGIVYHPARPYVLCVMSEGRRFEDLAQLIAEVSRLAFDEVSRQALQAPPP
jgi:beta-lactamase class A